MHVMPWYADICNFLMASIYPQGASKAYEDKLGSKAKYCIWDDPYLWRICNDQIQLILHFYHAATRGGNYGSDQTAWKVFDYGLYWPTIFRDTHAFISAYEQRKRAKMSISRRKNALVAYVKAKAIRTNEAKVMEFLKSYIFCKFDVPKALISDQGSHFYNRVMATLLEKYRVVHQIATAYHP
ncbi:hypothetical protein CR513_33647, partial [Mucuna pruriens]